MIEMISIPKAVNLFLDKVRKGKKPSDYYCGITNDLAERTQWHRAELDCYIECASVDKANSLEEALASAGFDCGKVQGNAHLSNSVYVYMYEKTMYTRETN